MCPRTSVGGIGLGPLETLDRLQVLEDALADVALELGEPWVSTIQVRVRSQLSPLM